MGKQVDNTFTWVIKNFSSLQVQPQEICSEQFVVGGCKWRLTAYPEVKNAVDYLSLSVYLDVSDYESLPCGWKRHAKFSLTIVNQLSEELSELQEAQQWFDQKFPGWGFTAMLNLKELSEKDGGFLMNDQVMIAVAIDVLEVIGTLDASEKSESMNVINGFQVLPSQVKSVNRLFEEHPDIASKLSIKNQSLKTAYMSVLLSLTDTLHQSPKEISRDDLSDAKTTLAYMKNVGFKLDWLENKLDELSKKKEKEAAMQKFEQEFKYLKQKCAYREALLKKEAAEIRMQKFEQEFKYLKQKCAYREALLKKEKTDVLVARAPLSLFNNDDNLKWIFEVIACTVMIMLLIFSMDF